MITIGLDLSINSTGICIYDTSRLQSFYYIISPKFTKKASTNGNAHLALIQYEKTTVDSKLDYSVKEELKTYNIYNIVHYIKHVLEVWKPNVVTIEGVSFGSTGSAALIDLSGLNYMVRMACIEAQVPNVFIVSPTQNKKFATGNGSAEKDVMISAWQKLEKHMIGVEQYVKVDDIADAYFMARYGESLLSN
jgi:Holliday junction resolvasome RuvABC endonuclease subunit